MNFIGENMFKNSLKVAHIHKTSRSVYKNDLYI